MKSHTYLALLLAFSCLFLPACAVAEDEFKSIFNGRDLSGWKGNTELWSVEDGAITGRTTDEDPIPFNTFLIWQGGEVADFELELEYIISGEKGNSGIQYRSRHIIDDKYSAEDYVVGGYQADIDRTMTYAGINYEERGRGILTGRGERTTIDAEGKKQAERFAEADSLGEKIKDGQWNSYRVVAKGNHLQHFINGELMSEVVDNQASRSSVKGVLAMQIHKGPAMVVQFKNIRLKQMK